MRSNFSPIRPDKGGTGRQTPLGQDEKEQIARRGAAPLTAENLARAAGNMLSVTDPVSMGLASMAEMATGQEPGTLGGVSTMEGYETRTPEQVNDFGVVEPTGGFGAQIGQAGPRNLLGGPRGPAFGGGGDGGYGEGNSAHTGGGENPSGSGDSVNQGGLYAKGGTVTQQAKVGSPRSLMPVKGSGDYPGQGTPMKGQLYAAGGSVGGGNRSGAPFGSLPPHMRQQRPMQQTRPIDPTVVHPAAPRPMGVRPNFGPTDGFPPKIPDQHTVPGYAAGGEVIDPNMVPDDGVEDNVPIMADEGEFVLMREAAEALGPEVLAVLNDPQMAPQIAAMLQPLIGAAAAAVNQQPGMGGAGGPLQGMEAPGGAMPTDGQGGTPNMRGEMMSARPKSPLGMMRAG